MRFADCSAFLAMGRKTRKRHERKGNRSLEQRRLQHKTDLIVLRDIARDGTKQTSENFMQFIMKLIKFQIGKRIQKLNSVIHTGSFKLFNFK